MPCVYRNRQQPRPVTDSRRLSSGSTAPPKAQRRNCTSTPPPPAEPFPNLHLSTRSQLWVVLSSRSAVPPLSAYDPFSHGPGRFEKLLAQRKRAVNQCHRNSRAPLAAGNSSCALAQGTPTWRLESLPRLALLPLFHSLSQLLPKVKRALTFLCICLVLSRGCHFPALWRFPLVPRCLTGASKVCGADRPPSTPSFFVLMKPNTSKHLLFYKRGRKGFSEQVREHPGFPTWHTCLSLNRGLLQATSALGSMITVSWHRQIRHVDHPGFLSLRLMCALPVWVRTLGLARGHHLTAWTQSADLL